MRALAQANRTLPQVAASSSDALANFLIVAMTADVNLTPSLWRGSTGQWAEGQLLSFSNQKGTSFSSSPDVNIPAIAVKNNHRLYGITADRAGIIEYEWSSSNPYTFTWASRINTTHVLHGQSSRDPLLSSVSVDSVGREHLILLHFE
jgi:hypothetical protein